jgi:phage shock protein PspC (stress-responsive transcriptional regulator)
VSVDARGAGQGPVRVVTDGGGLHLTATIDDMDEKQHEDPAEPQPPSGPTTTDNGPDATERIETPPPGAPGAGPSGAGPSGAGSTPPPPPYGGGPYAPGPQQPWQQPGPSTTDRLVQDVRALRRSRDDRVVAGVCGGVARQLGIDPLLVRVVTAVLVVFGAGVVLYAVAWLLLPMDDGTPSVGQQAVSTGAARSSTKTVLLAVALTIVATLGLGAAFSHWDGPFLIALAVGGLLAWLLLRDRRDERAPVSGYGLPQNQQTAGYTTSASAAGPVTLSKQPEGPAEPPAGWDATTPPPPYPQAGYQPPVGPPAGPYAYQPPATPPPPPAPRRPHSALFSVTMSLVLVGLGTLKLIDLAGTHIPAGAYPALALTIIGLGLLVGTWIGRSRGLIAMGVIAVVLTGAVSAGDAWDDHERGRVDLRLTPSSLAELPTSQDFGSGSVRYDLTRLDFTGVDRSLKLSVGAGEIVVIVPSDVDVTATASMGVGQVDLFGQGRGGLPSDVTVTDLGADGAGGGTLDLALDAGVGHLEVRRG